MFVNRALWFKVASTCLGVAACGDALPSGDGSSRDDVLVRDESHDVTLQDGGDDAPEEEISVEMPLALAGDAHARGHRYPRRASSAQASHA